MAQKKSVMIVENGCKTRVVHLERVDRARKEAISDGNVERIALIYKALADPTRLKILLALLSGEMCVCDLAALLGVSESAVSHQLRRLKDLALVKKRREGQVLYYAPDTQKVGSLVKAGLEHLEKR